MKQTKKGMVEIIKRKLRIFSKGHMYPSHLADCDESYNCLRKLNTTILTKINIALRMREWEASVTHEE